MWDNSSYGKRRKPLIYLCGLEQLEIWLKNFPDVAIDAKLELVDSPLIVSPDELAEVVQALLTTKQRLLRFSMIRQQIASAPSSCYPADASSTGRRAQ